MTTSMSSSATVTGYSTPKAACVFLAKFDRRQGYELVWSKSATSFSLDGLEYRVFPSGIHSYEENTIYLRQENNSQSYFGLARFRQLNLNTGSDNDRSRIRMYSLGVFMEPLKSEWKPNNFGNVGWKHLDAIDETLLAYLHDENVELLENLYQKLAGHGSLEVVKAQANPIVHHPLFRSPSVLGAVGPLIFPIYKAALLRKRILVFTHNSQSAELLHEGTNRDFAVAGALVYLMTIISAIPQEVSEIFGDKSLSTPLYTLCLHDTDGLAMKTPGYLASTSDEIVKLRKDLYDLAVYMPSSDIESCELSSGESSGKADKATFNDYTKFLKLYKMLPSVTSNGNGDDHSSIRTTSSFLSAFKLGGAEDNLEPFEPRWWRSNATTPMSWREYLWSAFAWFASAGTTNRDATEQFLGTTGEDSYEDPCSVKQQFTELTQVVGQFHRLTRKWFLLLDEIVTETLEDNGHNERRSSLSLEQPLERKVTVELAIQDIVDMELDPYSEQDIEFVKEFVLYYWGNSVEDVEIGIGLHGFCC